MNDERERLKDLAESSFLKVLENLDPAHRAIFSSVRFAFVEGYILGAKDVLSSYSAVATDVRRQFNEAQLQAMVAAKLGIE